MIKIFFLVAVFILGLFSVIFLNDREKAVPAPIVILEPTPHELQSEKDRIEKSILNKHHAEHKEMLITCLTKTGNTGASEENHQDEKVSSCAKSMRKFIIDAYYIVEVQPAAGGQK